MKDTYFTEHILDWGTTVERNMPWKNEKDPYLIWLSEIILQQTRVEQGLPYFLRFKEKYPNVKALAVAPQDEVLKLWQGLGYYSRARNLHQTAKHIAYDLGGQLPQDFEGLTQLKGVGHYTAAAIASFAYNLPHAVLDGNVYRVLSRFFGIHTPIDSTEGKKEFTQLANALVPADQPGAYNQAMMDFGALLCKPANPDCEHCPVADRCQANKQGLVAVLPIKAKKLNRRTRFFHYLVLEHDGNFYLSKRVKKDIWENLYEFPMVESDHLLERDELEKLSGINGLTFAGSYKQQLTHQQINAVFYVSKLSKPVNIEGWLKVGKEKLDNFAFPKVIDCYLKDNTLYFNFL